MMKVMTRETHSKLLKIVNDTVEEDGYHDGFTEQHTINGYLLNYEYDGNGVYKFDLLDEDGDLVFGVDGDFIEVKRDFYSEMSVEFSIYEKEVMSRDAYYGLLEQVEDTVEQDSNVVGFVERHAFDDYVLNYEYNGEGLYMFDLMNSDGETLFSVEGDLEYAKIAFRLRMREKYFDETRIGYQQWKTWYENISKPWVTSSAARIQDVMIVKYEKKDHGHVFTSEWVVTGRKQCTLSDADFQNAARDMMEDLDACGAFDSDDKPIDDEWSSLAAVAQELQGGE